MRKHTQVDSVMIVTACKHVHMLIKETNVFIFLNILMSLLNPCSYFLLLSQKTCLFQKLRESKKSSCLKKHGDMQTLFKNGLDL